MSPLGIKRTFQYVPAAMVLSVVEAQGKVPVGSSRKAKLPSLTLECLREESLGVPKETILQALCAKRVSAVAASVCSGRKALADLMGAVKERRTMGGILILVLARCSGVEGGEASAIRSSDKNGMGQSAAS